MHKPTKLFIPLQKTMILTNQVKIRQNVFNKHWILNVLFCKRDV